ncbi:hypothetical protein EDC01DRAFT_670571 [Geopyxis carbonaria]|nr:hypothetical protein EDC01DRAFT_670571 [Geopyxis carbonaria]
MWWQQTETMDSSNPLTITYSLENIPEPHLEMLSSVLVSLMAALPTTTAPVTVTATAKAMTTPDADTRAVNTRATFVPFPPLEALILTCFLALLALAGVETWRRNVFRGAMMRRIQEVRQVAEEARNDLACLEDESEDDIEVGETAELQRLRKEYRENMKSFLKEKTEEQEGGAGAETEAETEVETEAESETEAEAEADTDAEDEARLAEEEVQRRLRLRRKYVTVGQLL